MTHITSSQFRDRFAALFFGGTDLPKKQVDRHIIFISATLGIEPGRKYSENDINDELRKWTSVFGARYNLDHVTLRRHLVDEGYITRDSSGRSYELVTTDLPYTFDRSLEGLRLEELIDEAKTAKELKKRQYLKGS